MTTYLYTAYCVTWAVIIVYVVTLNTRASKLRSEWDELRKNK